MSRFDPPAPRFNPQPDPPLAPPPVYQHDVRVDQGTEIPPPTDQPNVPNQSNNGNLMRVVALSLRGLSMVFSFLCFVIIATIKDFNTDDSYNYVFSVAIISFMYNVYQNGKGVFVLVTRKEFIRCLRLCALIDFIGDQVIAYMLISASSVGLVLSNELRQQYGSVAKAYGVTSILDKTAGGSSMLFFAFLALVFPTLFSGHKLSQAFASSN